MISMPQQRTVPQEQEVQPVSLPEEPPTEYEAGILRAWLQYSQSMYNRLHEAGSPWADVIAMMASLVDEVLSPEDATP